MFFKNIRVYQLTEKLNLNKRAFESALAEHKFAPCMGQDALKLGFAFAVHPSVKELVTELGDGLFMVALKRQEKVLPAAVINEELQPKIDALEAEKGRPLGRKEKQALKEELIQTLLPRAFSRSTLTHALIDDTNGLVFIDTASPSRAEDLLALLRKSIGSLPAVPWIDSNMLSQSLQRWVAGQNLPAGYVLGHAARFKAPDEEGARASFENHLLSAAEVQSHLEDKLATELDLVKPEQLEFRITDCGGIKRLRWEELLINWNDELGWEDLVVRIEADALLMRSELVGMVSAIRTVVCSATKRVDLREITCEATDAVTKNPIWNAEDEDPLYQDAVQFVVECQKVSVSGIQRKFRISYKRSAYIVDAMERHGIVSEPEHNGSRRVLLKAA
ncbi:MAG: recombination-associated protein RdgC [Rheinheimera sp.]|nr:recombination-associated protein RdgC [Rheinheimera sp.]